MQTQNSNQSMDVDVDDDDNKNDTEQSILWRFYAQKRGYEGIEWPTFMDDTYFADRPDVVRSEDNLTSFTFLNANPEWNARRSALHMDSDDEDSENNTNLSVNFRSNKPIPTDVFMYYFEVKVSHNLIQSHNAKFKRCYFGLLPRSKIHFPPNNEEETECKILENVHFGKKKSKKIKRAMSSTTASTASSLKLLANVACHRQENEC